MGNITSTPVHKDIFKKELQGLNTLVTDLVTTDNLQFKKQKYKVAMKNICDSYNIVLESQLKKHLKVELKSLKDSIYLFPTRDAVHLKDGKTVTKDDLCKLIGSHYHRILKLLVLVKHVYDVEHHGNNSLAGIIMNNINMTPNIFEMHFCDVSQKMVHKGNGIDFSMLTGFQFLCNDVMSKTEKTLFLKTMRNLFARKNIDALAEHMACGDSLLSAADYKEFLQYTSAKHVACKQSVANNMQQFAETKEENMYMFVAKNNPMLHDSELVCSDKRQLLIDISKKTKPIKELIKKYELLQDLYKKNIAEIVSSINKLVEKDLTGGYSLRDIDAKSLEDLEVNIKKLCVKFYIQTLVGYQSLLDFAKTLNPRIVNWKDRIQYDFS